ncbi:hypothetical protein [Psychroserpens sp. SPM9]|uniref:hypothetical protein n=1 Tax=Psychroserpens sp. SPM9 TaxID=2975598 RepID=UPI0021A2C69A|nr:hypothetical protein [Psychroserpens sp. SPM9]MDG5489947.1 hypothetical protein [Psychroserpens sp. SPM9]
MKKIILIALAFVTLQGVAQDKKRGDRDGKRDMAKDMSAEDIATLGSKKLTLALDLSEKQQAQVKEVLLEQATARKEKMEERQKEKEKEDAKKPSKEERVKMMNARLDDQIAMKKKMKSILTAEQFEKWETMQAKRHSNSKGKHKKRGQR